MKKPTSCERAFSFLSINPGNRSSGTIGFRIAERAAARGAHVTLIAGPVSKATPVGVTRVDVTDARSMKAALTKALGEEQKGADALVMAAAVADYRPKDPSASKMKRSGEGITLELVPNDDLLADIGAARVGHSPVLIGFALETEDGKALIELARGKLTKKKVDLVVANSADVALGGENSRVTLVTTTSARDLGPRSKGAIAEEILDFVRDRLAER